MTDKKKLLRYFAYTIEIIAIYLLNEAPGLTPPVLGACPVLLLPVAVSIIVFESETTAMGFGFFYGVLLGFGMSDGAVLGLHMLLLSVLCFCAGLMTIHLLRANLLAGLPLSAAVVGLILLLQRLLYYVSPGYEYSGFVLVSHSLPHFVYTLLPMPLIYASNQAFAPNIRGSAG